MTYFTNCKTKQEAKKLFRDLAKQYHPDKNKEDTTNIMAAIISEYESIIKTLPTDKAEYDKYKNETKEQQEIRINKEMQEVLNNIGHLPLDIEIIGTWLWISGETKKYKSYLTANNCLWHPKKTMFYWRPYTDSKRYKNKKHIGIDEIRDKYGSQKVSTNRKAIQA